MRSTETTFKPRGFFDCEHWRDGKLLAKFRVSNGITNEGINKILDVMFHAVSPITTWYAGLIDNASFSALAAGDTMSSHAGWIELTAYDEATRREWTEGAASGQSMTNSVQMSVTISATKTLKGLFITSGSVKGGTTGTLWATASFPSTVACVDNDVFNFTYTVSGS